MTASLYEIIQTAASGLGVMMSLKAMVNADLNLVTAVRRNLDGNKKMLARRNVRTERCIVVLQLCLAGAGAITLFLPPPPYPARVHVSSSIGAQTNLPVKVEEELTAEEKLHNDIDTGTSRSSSVRLFFMTVGSLVMMYLSYRNWLEERIPISLVGATIATAQGQATRLQEQMPSSSRQDIASELQIGANRAQANVVDEDGEIP